MRKCDLYHAPDAGAAGAGGAAGGGAGEEDAKGLAKAAFAERDEWKAKAREASAKVEKFEAEAAERARVAREAESKAESEKLAQQGKYAESLERERKARDEAISRERQNAARTILPLAIASAARGIAGLAPSALEDLPLLVGGTVRINPETMQPEVVGEDGKAKLGADLKPVALVDHLKEIVSRRPHLMLDSTARGAGEQAGSVDGTKAEKIDVDKYLQNPVYAKQVHATYKPEEIAAATREFFSGDRAIKMAREKYGVK